MSQEFIINGVSRSTGHQATLRLRAEDEKAAEAEAQKHGVNPLTVQPVAAADAGPVASPDDPGVPSLEDGPAPAKRSLAALAVLLLLVAAGVGVLVYTAPKLYNRATDYYQDRKTAKAVDIQVKPISPTSGVPTIQGAAKERQAIALPDLLVTSGITLAGLALVILPGVALKRRMRPPE
jgi:hypothetical protein